MISKSIDVSENNKNDFSNLEFNIKIKTMKVLKRMMEVLKLLKTIMKLMKKIMRVKKLMFANKMMEMKMMLEAMKESHDTKFD